MALSVPYHIILGSQSPRRKELLANLGLEFTQRSLDADESYPKDLRSKEVAEYLSRKKAAAGLATLQKNEMLITSDTTVVLGKKILNKASNEKEAAQMLRELSAKKHKVISGVCLSTKEKAISFSVTTKVYFKKLSKEEIEYYIANYQPFDKAGAYGIQEWIGMIGVKKIKGSYYNVMGLPLKELYEELRKF